MTQEEVDLIYDYLHEYYRYEEGELIHKTKKSKLGCFIYYGKDNRTRAVIQTCLTINEKKYYIRLSHLIYIYHHKIKPQRIFYKDKNITNLNIDNLYTCNQNEFFKIENFITPPKGYTNVNNAFRVTLSKDYKNIYIASYESEEEAKMAYFFSKELICAGISIEEIKRQVLDKYPSLNRTNKTGYIGVYKKNNKFVAQFKSKKIGYFSTAQEAHAAYLVAKNK